MSGATSGTTTRFGRAAAILLTAAFAFRLWFMTTLPLSGDEAYYWQWSEHLAGAYYDHPGLTAWLIRVSTEVFGTSSELPVRVPALGCMTLLAIVCYRFARQLAADAGANGESAARAGFAACAAIVLVPITAAFATYSVSDPPMLLFSGLTIAALYRALDAGRWRDWLAAGLAFGLALECKFLAALLLPGALCYTILSGRYRTLAWRRALAAAGITVLALTPLLWWNVENDWATFRFNFATRQEHQSVSWHNPIDFVAGQLVMLSPGCAVVGVLACRDAVRSWRDERSQPALFLACMSLLPLGALLLISFRRDVGMHWTVAAWFGALLWCAVSWSCGRAWLGPRLVRWSAGICLAMLAGAHVALHLPPSWFDLELAWGPRKKSVNVRAIRELYGWRELGARVAATLRDLGQESRGAPFLLGSNYGIASAARFYTPGHPESFLWVGPGIRHGQGYRHWSDFAALRGRNAVYVTKRRVEQALPSLRRHFARVGDPEELVIERGDYAVRSFFLVRCYGFDGREWTPD